MPCWRLPPPALHAAGRARSAVGYLRHTPRGLVCGQRAAARGATRDLVATRRQQNRWKVRPT